MAFAGVFEQDRTLCRTETACKLVEFSLADRKHLTCALMFQFLTDNMVDIESACARTLGVCEHMQPRDVETLDESF